MSNIEFLKYEETPGEKHFGIATVRLYGKVVLRYKIVPNRDGTGFFPCAASYKMPAAGGEPERYVPSFILDSNSEKDEVEGIIKAHVKHHMTKHSTQQQNGQHGPSGAEYRPSTAMPSTPQGNQSYAGQQNWPPQQQTYQAPRPPEPTLPGFDNMPPSWPPNSNDGMPF